MLMSDQTKKGETLNKGDRNELDAILEDLELLMGRLDGLKDEIEQKAANMEAFFPDSERAERLAEEFEELDNAYAELESALDRLQELV